MQEQVIKIKNYANKESIISKILPIFLLLSFIWLDLYTRSSSISGLLIGQSVNIPLYFLLCGVVDYLIFEILFYIYRIFIGFSIYSFMIPKRVLKDKFRFWYIVRNIVLGIFFNLRFFFPYIGTYLCVFELTLNFAFIICLFFDLARNYVEPLVGQFVFKTLAVPVVIYEVYKCIVLLAGVL